MQLADILRTIPDIILGIISIFLWRSKSKADRDHVETKREEATIQHDNESWNMLMETSRRSKELESEIISLSKSVNESSKEIERLSSEVVCLTDENRHLRSQLKKLENFNRECIRKSKKKRRR